MLYYENGDLLDDKYKIIVHQGNCRGVMAAGLAKQIRNKFPNVYYDYIKALKYENATLGHIIISHSDQRIIITMLAQDEYGTDKRYTDYDAFIKCLDVILSSVEIYSCKVWDSIAFPYKIGCGLAGGDWDIIKAILEKFSEKTKKKVIIVRK